MTEVVQAAGDFWTAEQPAFRVSGEFTAELGQKPEVALTQNLVDDPRVSIHSDPPGRVTGWAVSALPERSVKSFLPITLHGELDSGELVTVLSARNYGLAGRFAPRYRGTAAIVGAHVSKSQLYGAVRFRMDRPRWLLHLVEGDSSRVEDDGSMLRADIADSDDWANDNWLKYHSSIPVSLRQLEIRVISGCLALLNLAMYPDASRTTRETQVRIEPRGSWLDVYGPSFCDELGSSEIQPLLTPDQLTIERYAKWIELHSKLDGLTWVVARPFTGAAQTRLLTLTTLLEGFHRALPDYEKAKFPGVDKGSLQRIAEAARRAAGAQAEAEGADRQRVEDAVAFYTEVSFQQRAEAVVAEVGNVAPEIAASVANLPRRITKARNDLAHDPMRGADKPIESRALEWRVLSDSLSWMLRCLLLLRVGIEPELVRERLSLSQRFGFFRANTVQQVNELGWELP